MNRTKKIEICLALLFVFVGVSAQISDWQWVTNAGGQSHDKGNEIAVDNAGNSYVVGYYTGGATFGSITLTGYSQQGSIYVAKMSSNGSWLWAKSAGHSTEYSYWKSDLSITLDNDNNVLICGFFEGTATFGSTSLVSYGSYDVFVSKLDNNGNWLWAKKAGGSGDDRSRGVSVDDNGNVYVTGYFNGSATFDTLVVNSNGGSDIFIAKLDGNGNWLWVNSAGSTYNDYGIDTVLVDNVNIIVVGNFRDSVSFGTSVLISNGDYDVFVAKLDLLGNWVSSYQGGGAYEERVWSLAVDNANNIYMTGRFSSTTSFGATNLASNGSLDIFVAKMSNDGNWLWARQAGGSSLDEAYSIAVDRYNSVFITGYFRNIASFGDLSMTSVGVIDIFVAKLNQSGDWIWAKQAGGNEGGDYGWGIALDHNSNIYATGYYYLAATFDGITIPHIYNYDIYVARAGDTNVELLSPNGGEQWQASSTKTIYWTAQNYTGNINIYLSTDNGVSWLIMNPSPVNISQGNYSISIPSITSTQCLLKIEIAEYQKIFDISDDNFTISNYPPSNVFITAPSNPKFKVGESCTISWVSFGVNSVNLEYSIDAGLSWNVIAVGIPSSIGLYNWTVPDTPGQTCYFRITDASDPTIYDWSDQPFKIYNLILSSPIGGEFFQAGSTRSVTWSSSQIANLKLEYSNTSGSSWTTIVSSTPASSGSYNWTVPTNPSDQYLVRISDASDASIYEVSDEMFTVVSLDVIYPDIAGIKLQIGKPVIIAWSQSYLPGTVKIELSTNNGSSYTNIATGVNSAVGSYSWTVDGPISTTCKIRVTSELDALVRDSSNSIFSIGQVTLLTPNGSEVWGSGSIHAISWSADTVTNVPYIKIEYTLDNGLNWLDVAGNVAYSSGIYGWTIPTAYSSQCRVRISDVESALVLDASNNVFSIRPQIILSHPNGGEIIAYNQIYSIMWSVTPDVSNVLIDYSIDNGNNWLSIQGSAYPAYVGRYDWIVPNNSSTFCLVRVQNSADIAFFDVSDSVFTINDMIVAPSVVFSADLTEGHEPLLVQFIDSSEPGSGVITDWLWDFGDGYTSSIQSPQHTYQNDGLYSVSLTVTNSYDSTAVLVRTDYINVLPRFPVLGEVDPNVNFGNAYLGYNSDIRDLWITNIGTADLIVDSISTMLSSTPFELLGLVLPIQIAEGDSALIQLRFVPQSAGTISDSLFIHNNSDNTPLVAVHLIGTGIYVPPLPPENVTISMNGDNAVISWDDVTQTIFYTPITPDYYLVFYNGSSDAENGLYYFLAWTPNLTYTHDRVGLHANNMFYRVVAYKYFGRSGLNLTGLGLEPGMTEEEVMRRLDVLRR